MNPLYEILLGLLIVYGFQMRWWWYAVVLGVWLIPVAKTVLA